MKESQFQAKLIKELKTKFDGSIVLKTDPCYKQGIPDLIILHGDKWAALECKKNSHSSHRPNQDFYISKMNKMSYATFVSPENKEQVINELEQTFKSRR